MMHYLFSRQSSVHCTREYREVFFAEIPEPNRQEEKEQRTESPDSQEQKTPDLNKNNVDQTAPEETKKVIDQTEDQQQKNQKKLNATNDDLKTTSEETKNANLPAQEPAFVRGPGGIMMPNPNYMGALVLGAMPQQSDVDTFIKSIDVKKGKIAGPIDGDVALNAMTAAFKTITPAEKIQFVDDLNAKLQQNGHPEYVASADPAGDLVIQEQDKGKLTQKERNQIVADAEADLGDLNALKKMKPEDRDKKIANVQSKHGVEVTEEKGTYKVTVPEEKGDVAMNKIMGNLMKVGLLFQKFSKIFEKFGGKKKEDDKKDEEKTPEEKNKEEGLQAMKDSGVEFDPADAFDNPDADEYVVKKPDTGPQNVPHVKFENGKWMMLDDERVKQGKPWQETMSYDAGRPDTDKWDALLSKLSKGNTSMKDSKNQKVASDKEKAILDAVDGDVWKKPKEGGDYNFKKAKDGKIYREKGSVVDVRDGDKWVNVAQDAGITDPTAAATYNNVFKAGGDAGWVRYGVTQHLYRIDLPSKALYSSTTVGGNQQYQPGTNSWQNKTFPS